MLNQTAIAASVDLRCYGLTSPRSDGKISVHFQDMENFYHEWDVGKLPWDAATAVAPGDEHPEELDQRLVDALNQALNDFTEEQKASRGGSLAFLYLYMILAGSHNR